MKTNDKLHWNAYKFFRQEVKREIRLAERIYVKSQIVNSKGNTNSIWKVINRCLPKKSSGLPQSNDSHENMANSFNKYFSSVGSLTALKAGQLAKDQNWTLDSNAYGTSNVSTLSDQFEFQPVSENDVANIILCPGAWVGRCDPDVQTLTLFKTQFSDFPIPFKTEFKIYRPYLRHLTQNHTLFKTRMK